MPVLSVAQTFGPFVVGEIPEPARFTFQRPGGAVFDITGYEAEVDITTPDGITTTEPAIILDAENGSVKYVFSEPLNQPGDWFLLFWIYSGTPETSRLAGSLLSLQIKEAPRHA